jgi:ankyrin repeat protein
VNRLRITALLLWACCLAFLCDGCGRSPSEQKHLDEQLFQSIEKSDLASVQKLVKQSANIEAKDADGATPVVMAAANGDAAIVKFLLDRGANADVRDSSGVTLFVKAVRVGQANVLELLIQRGVPRATMNEAVFSVIEYQPMIIGVSDDATPYFKTAKLLLDKGAEVNARDEEGATPLIEAAGFGHVGIARMLIDRGADLEARAKNGGTALLFAACDCALATMHDTYDVIKLLLEKGADINAADNQGDTPLMIASSGGVVKTDIVRSLLEHGANQRLKNAQGETALSIAMKSDVPDVVRLLKHPPSKSH